MSAEYSLRVQTLTEQRWCIVMCADSKQPQQQQQQAVGGERSLYEYEAPLFLMDPVQFSKVRKQKGLGRGEADR
jgi:hypothetical protein